MSAEDRDWQRADKWLWCARFMKHRADCAKLVEAGGLRINRQPTDKPHARLRIGDVVTVAAGRSVRVLVVAALAARRGPPDEARALYREIPEAAPEAGGCGVPQTAAYPASAPTDARSA